MNMNIKIKKIYSILFKANKKYIGDNFLISPLSRILGIPKIGNNVIIHSRCLIECRKSAILEILDGVEINVDSRITSSNKVIIGNNVLFGPNVYVTDSTHNYENINIPIKAQGIVGKGTVTIGDDSWLGKNSVIIGNVKIGKHCVIGASTVVTKDIPDYCVVVGNPGRIVKKYNIENKKWEKV